MSTNPRAKELTEDINKLKEQAATLESYHATAGLSSRVAMLDRHG